MRNEMRAGGHLATVTGLAVLIGWYGGLHALATVHKRFGSMRPNAVLAIVPLGVAVALLSRGRYQELYTVMELRLQEPQPPATRAPTDRIPT